ncbi:MAG TPA: UDP-N-acetylmuramoyl-L-alanyl-D-glutamate--2,6-diaminopimelate ligase [Thiobacillus sp.]|nr:UDP-N-acetylmuramoyl-L-alanyl-D-glutamate--2,6-diaminopimelate ligase [Gammaproteobacteria bacterium]OYZ28146.1 MAG: UDP-N-acetylmuramoyl-L-alanyl-D-glutamate--2,6-diaminopimelate ligase [Hydrogenophilales bacterium 16-64-40]OZA34079.1 MAG: UDP-N-acetylmuramoyl-L-alanyl-D-glutamate--2,6-diaminopimelate ligase [Hydrogenophilales bacterium 17-64-65]HQS83065.1 UDP-N-acetylmuramoyl-L-alanyl-D-glutamate--2,6-diaminopimelate ligase [Thiobacillus sp.]HQT33678.1 UDP-N-acetylmuramoyl-L-alanyl-D-gluta
MANPQQDTNTLAAPQAIRESVPHILERLGIAVAELVSDSRRAMPGVVFAAYPGEARDGRDFIAQAVAQRVDGVLWEADHYQWDPALAIPNAGVTGLKNRIGEIAAHVYGEPSRALHMVGITGTNGKTSVAHWVAQTFSQLGRKTAVIGTVGNGFPGALTPALNTTPDAIELQQRLAHFRQQGATACAMEVSSHGLAQGRLNGTQFSVAVLTNLSRDHLDYHGDMDSYAAAKARLFSWPGLEWAVVNLDDAFGKQLEAETRLASVAGYGFRRGAVVGEKLRLSQAGLHLVVRTDWGTAEVDAPLLGRFNAANLLAVLATLLVSGVKLDDACQALTHITPPPGRMQTLGGNAHPLVVVDYAHTPDALEKVLATLREIVSGGRLICVFGCGGNRDRGKRPLMGQAAVAGADEVWITSDNPRNEDPRRIIDDVLAGTGDKPHVESDRARAIFEAIGGAHHGDVVVIAGKGHEDFQEIAGERQPFSDVAVARKALEAWT